MKVTRIEWSSVRDFYEADLDPKDFVEYDDEDDVEMAIIEELWDRGTTDSEYTDTFDSETNIPEEFFEKWRELKNGN